MEGPGIETRWQRNFPPPIQTGPGAHPPSYTMVTSYFSGLKRPWRRTDYPAPSSSGLQIGRNYTSMFRLCQHWPVIGCEIFPTWRRRRKEDYLRMNYGENYSNHTQPKRMDERKIAGISAVCLMLFQKGASAFFYTEWSTQIEDTRERGSEILLETNRRGETAGRRRMRTAEVHTG